MGLTVFALASVWFVCFHAGKCAESMFFWFRKNTKGRSLWLWLLPFFVCAGFWRGCDARMTCARELALGLDGKALTVTGEIIKRELREDGSWRVTLRQVSGFQEGAEFCLERLQVYLDAADPEPECPYRIGAKVSLNGIMQSFDAACNPGEFDYRLYARSQKLNYRMFADDYTVMAAGSRPIRENLAWFREWAGDVLERISDPKDYGVYRAAVLGDSSRMDEELYGLYQDNGVAHLLAVSGLHLSLISAAVYGTLRKVGAGYGLSGAAGTAVLMLYALLTGESASVLRALIMGICGFAAAYLGRTYDLMSAWSLALVMLLWDSPYQLLQAGVQLSFGALAGIGWLAPKIRNVSISMQLMTLPILLYHYFQYPLYGILLNFLMVPLMGGVVASGVAGIVFGGAGLAIGSCLFGAPTLAAGRFVLGSGHVILKWYEFCCQMASRLPGNVVVVGRPEAWKIGVYYGVLFVTALWIGKEKQKEGKDEKTKAPRYRWKRFLPFAVIVLLLFIPAPTRDLRVTFLDVGQGDGICIQIGAKTLLVDGGSTDQKRLGEYRLVPFLHSQGISSIDYAIVSHGDADHISGLQYLLETGEVKIETLILPSPGRGEGVYEELADLAKESGSRVYWMTRGDRLRIRPTWRKQELNIACLSPDKILQTTDKNEHSLVLKLDYGEFHMLLTGDMTEANEQEILREYQREVLQEIQVLKVAHHGSDTSSSELWIEAIHPRWAVLSYGEGNRYGHPKQAVMERLQNEQAVIYETAKSGAVWLETGGRKIHWSTYK